MHKTTLTVLVLVVTLHCCFTCFQWLKSARGQAGGGAEEPFLELPFQGRLLKPDGMPVDPVPTDVLFKIHTHPVAPCDDCWSSTKRVTVKPGGFFSTTLGSRENPLDSDIFSRELYLGIRVGRAGRPIEAEPEMLPRIPILPALFAHKAGRAYIADDSEGLAGRNWRSILVGDSNDPVASKIRGERIEDGGIGTAQIADLAVDTDQIAAGAVTREKLAAPPFQVSQLITFSRVLRHSSFPSQDTSVYDIPQTVTIQTSGRPVWVGLRGSNIPGSSDQDGCVRVVNANSEDDSCALEASLLPASPSLRTCFGIDSLNSSTNVNGLLIPAGVISFLDIPPAGTQTYQLRIRNPDEDNAITVTFDRLELFAYEL